MMTGSFSSAAQAERDTNYYHISLHMYPIWQSKYPGEHWLYVEQAVAAMPEKPYRQRVYHVEKVGDNQWSSAVYTLADPGKWVGKWKTPGDFDQIDKGNLSEREGCAVLLSKTGPQQFSGSTDAEKCQSSLRGATYATSRVTVQPDLILSWDQGFDAKGNQVWGATEGGYEFIRIKN